MIAKTLNKKFVLVALLGLIIVSPVIYLVVKQDSKSNVHFESLAIDEKYCFPFHFYQNVPIYKQQAGMLSIPEEIIINSQAEYDELLKYRRSSSENCSEIQSEFSKSSCERRKECENSSLPSVDFSKSTVLGKYSSGSCAAKDFEQKLWLDDDAKTLTYSVYPNESGWFSCSGPGIRSMNFIVIPKIPNTYEIEFSPELSSQNDYREYQSDPENPEGWIERDTHGNVVSRGEEIATSGRHIEASFSDCLPKDVIELMRNSGGIISDDQICEE